MIVGQSDKIVDSTLGSLLGRRCLLGRSHPCPTLGVEFLTCGLLTTEERRSLVGAVLQHRGVPRGVLGVVHGEYADRQAVARTEERTDGRLANLAVNHGGPIRRRSLCSLRLGHCYSRRLHDGATCRQLGLGGVPLGFGLGECRPDLLRVGTEHVDGVHVRRGGTVRRR